MKTEIKINHENLSRYSKRTQKVLKEVLGQDIKLNEASLILSKILGVNSTHELKKLLEYDLIEDFKERLHRNPQETSLEKVLLITKQIQKMMLATEVEFSYSLFANDYAGISLYREEKDFNGIEPYNFFTGFSAFEYDPEEDIDESRIDDIVIFEKHAIEFINLKETEARINNKIDEYESGKNHHYHTEEKMALFYKMRNAFNNKKQKNLIKELLHFIDEMVFQITKYLKTADDFWLVERNKITIKIGDNLTIYQ